MYPPDRRPWACPAQTRTSVTLDSNVAEIKREAVVSLLIPPTKTVGLRAPHPRQIASGRKKKGPGWTPLIYCGLAATNGAEQQGSADHGNLYEANSGNDGGEIDGSYDCVNSGLIHDKTLLCVTFD